MSDGETNQTIDTPNFAPRLYGIALLVAAIILGGMWLVWRYTAMDIQRDLQNWQEKLNLIAESRSTDIDKWISGHFNELQALADNPSMQLYLTELQMASQDEKAKPANGQNTIHEPAEKGYLRNLMLFTAQQDGFIAQNNTLASIHADVQPENKSGLAVVDNNGKIIVSTLITASTQHIMAEQAKNFPAGQRGLIDMQKDSDGTLYMGFVVPIFSIQGEHNANSQIGRLVGIMTIGDNLFSLLKPPNMTEKTLEVMLLRPDDNYIDYLSPLLDGSAALSKRTEREPKSAENELIYTVGNFSNGLQDYRKEVVLATSRHIADTPWVLAVKIDRKEAFAHSSRQRVDMMIFFFCVIAIIVLIIVAIWWYAHSQRAMMMSRHFRKMAAAAQAQEKLLRLVADNQPEPIFILDKHRVYQFANQKAADEVGMTAGSLVGKNVSDVRGAARAEPTTEQCEKALEMDKTGYDVRRFNENGQDTIVRSVYVPLEHVPVAGLRAKTAGVLVVEQDISEVIHEREQRLNTQRQLVQTLVRIVDMRDPFAANHSLLVAQVAHEIGVQMDLDSQTLETTRTAGSLMNIGKIVVPTMLLTKTGSLTDEEKAIVRQSMDTAANLLGGIDFDGPVVETLKQWQEKWDGSGPLHLTGDAILISARIIAVANAFVGMISPRAWRHAMTIEAANKFLLEESDSYFDRRVVIALINYMENHHGRAWLKQIMDDAKQVA